MEPSSIFLFSFQQFPLLLLLFYYYCFYYYFYYFYYFLINIIATKVARMFSHPKLLRDSGRYFQIKRADRRLDQSSFAMTIEVFRVFHLSSRISIRRCNTHNSPSATIVVCFSGREFRLTLTNSKVTEARSA